MLLEAHCSCVHEMDVEGAQLGHPACILQLVMDAHGVQTKAWGAMCHREGSSLTKQPGHMYHKDGWVTLVGSAAVLGEPGSPPGSNGG